MQKMLSYAGAQCHAPPMTNPFLNDPAARRAAQGQAPSRVYVVTLVTFRAEI